MNGPPSSGHDVMIGSRSNCTSLVTTSSTGALAARRIPIRSSFSREIARAPQLGRCWRQQRFREVDEAFDQAKRALAECEPGAARRAEQVGHERKRGALDVGEKQGWPAGGNHAPVNFRRFENGIDLSRDFDQTISAPQLVKERTEIAEQLKHCSVQPA